MKDIVLTALNNNGKLWYEQFIPFIISLRTTTYNGDIGVINYGLPQNALNVLKKNNIIVFEPSNIVSNLALDRHFSAYTIAKDFGYDKVALFDADIWFPSEKFTLFENIIDHNVLYATPDNQISTFIYNCIQDSNQEGYSYKDLNNKLVSIAEKYGFIWQLGLVAGHKNAWKSYNDYLYRMIKNSFVTMSYGIDTTLFNLYSAEKDQVKPLHKKYNCIPNWEINFIFQSEKFKYFTVDNEIVEAIHTPGDFRLNGQYSLAKLFPNKLIELGKVYRLEDSPVYHIIEESLTYPKIENSHKTLKLEYAKANYIKIKTLDNTEISQTLGALCLEVGGYSKICLSNYHDKEIKFIYSYHALPHHDLCDSINVYKEGLSSYLIKENKYYSVILSPNEKIYFQTDAVDINTKKIRWVFENMRLV